MVLFCHLNLKGSDQLPENGCSCPSTVAWLEIKGTCWVCRSIQIPSCFQNGENLFALVNSVAQKRFVSKKFLSCPRKAGRSHSSTMQCLPYQCLLFCISLLEVEVQFTWKIQVVVYVQLWGYISLLSSKLQEKRHAGLLKFILKPMKESV